MEPIGRVGSAKKVADVIEYCCILCGVNYWEVVNNYRQQQSCGKGNVFTPICDSVHRGVSPWQSPPPDRDPPPRQRSPLNKDPPNSPPTETPPYGNERAVLILLECILVFGIRMFFGWVLVCANFSWERTQHSTFRLHSNRFIVIKCWKHAK